MYSVEMGFTIECQLKGSLDKQVLDKSDMTVRIGRVCMDACMYTHAP